MHLLNETLHTPVRLQIMVHLMQHQKATFMELRKALQIGQGNLSTHLRRLEQKGYIFIEKGFQNRKPVTTIHLTQEGKKAFLTYIAQLRSLLAPFL